MDKKTIKQLNQVNQEFYKNAATDFSDSRTYYWHGWRELLPYLETMIAEKEQLSVLDVGCGNGRFGSFLVDYLPAVPIDYTGLDASKKLLSIAKNRLKKTHLDFELSEVDITDRLLEEKPIINPNKQYDLIVLFGVLHHVPSYKLRKQLVVELSQRLAQQGLFTFTLWRFLDDEKLEKKQLDSTEANLKEDKLDYNDYLISWERETSGVRYCHYANHQEEERLVNATNLELLDSFEADGREGRGNKYLVLGNEAGV